MALGDNCSSSCLTRDHESFGECLRGKSLRVGYCQSASGQDYTQQKKFDADLAFYKSAREQGIQPASTDRTAVERAFRISEKHGKAYRHE